ncbi:uncharacterized protein LOC118452535 [Egretta garzetta]|uniref:uncharacterized protein LOC118452535 n=1 Tax=Egretta garzetta TaxID=188379 RepID=UPI00163C7DE7|nr:uncharacterized protein LOC118452535 [Egretta garzetta]
MLDCPKPLMRRDLLSKLDAQITFKNREIQKIIPQSKIGEVIVFMLQEAPKPEEPVPVEVDNAVIPLVGADELLGQSKLAEKHVLKPRAKPTIEQVYSSIPNLKDIPLTDPSLELFTDGSSFVRDGRGMAGYAVVTATQVMEANSLRINTSAQKAELVALQQALRLAEGKKVNIWTDSKSGFGIVRALRAVWKERVTVSPGIIY